MSPGRTPSWNVIAGVVSDSWLEAISPSSDGRVLLPVELRKRVSWASPKRSLSLLAITQGDGAVVVAPLSESSDEIRAVGAAFQAAPAAERPLLVFAAMALYARVSLQPDGRLRLSPGLARHLLPKGDEPIWVGAHCDQVWLWQEEAWAKTLSSAADTLRTAMYGRKGRD
jgi:bifunctional DNA-binding transcriptional regulator/antitoxin component of YhaV-PrlF toxin-antitoxin module